MSVASVNVSPYEHMDVSKNRGFPPKLMVKIMEHPIKMDDLGGFPIIFGKTHMLVYSYLY